MKHGERSPLSGATVMILPGVTHPQVDSFGGSAYRVEDWADRVLGKSWMDATGNPAALIYAMRTGLSGNIPTDDDVLYGKVGSLGHLVHVSEVTDIPVVPQPPAA